MKKTAEELAQFFEFRIKAEERKHSKSNAIDWIKVAAYKIAEELIFIESQSTVSKEEIIEQAREKCGELQSPEGYAFVSGAHFVLSRLPQREEQPVENPDKLEGEQPEEKEEERGFGDCANINTTPCRLGLKGCVCPCYSWSKKLS